MFANRFRTIAKTSIMPLAKAKPMNFVATRAICIEQAKKMPKKYSELPNDVLITIAVMGDQEAREERVIREIMSVDNVTW